MMHAVDINGVLICILCLYSITKSYMLHIKHAFSFGNALLITLDICLHIPLACLCMIVYMNILGC